ncbi:helix-turn-helix transcriptional regulator [Micromonospora sp. NPDC047548]|uniref:helix-turn-helix domain-containing protein n=1 Tax=Micromonospora sp. NPDC047548 TaxID=3155624 RepID=UPI00340E4595
MTNAATDTVRTLSDAVAEEIRVLLTRRKWSQRRLAQELNVSPAWLNYRLTGVQAIDLNDLQRIADVLQVSVAALLPAPFRPNDRSG